MLMIRSSIISVYKKTLRQYGGFFMEKNNRMTAEDKMLLDFERRRQRPASLPMSTILLWGRENLGISF